MTYETRLTDSGTPSTSRTKPVKPLQSIFEEAFIDPNIFSTASRPRKKYALLCLHPGKLCLGFVVILQPLTLKTTWRRSCFTVR